MCLMTQSASWHIRGLMWFLGASGTHRLLLPIYPNYAKIDSLLSDLLKKEWFQWLEQVEEAFVTLKTTKTSASMLALPDFSIPLELECNTSDNEFGPILMQREKPIVFVSHILSKCAQGLSTYKMELMTIVKPLCKWRPYLLGSQFIIKTNHSSLKYLFEQQITTTTQ